MFSAKLIRVTPQEQREGRPNVPEAIPLRSSTLKRAGVELHELPTAILASSLAQAAKEESVQESVAAPAVALTDEAGAVVRNVRQRPLKEGVTLASAVIADGEVIVENEELDGETAPVARVRRSSRSREYRSRFHVRGIHHPTPKKFYLAALGALFVRVMILPVLVLMAAISLQKVPLVWGWSLLGFALLAIFSLALCHSTTCRVCGTKEFVANRSLKHKKAHRLPLLGPVVSSALHLLLFGWIYCMFCGTAVRTRGSKKKVDS